MVYITTMYCTYPDLAHHEAEILLQYVFNIWSMFSETPKIDTP